MDDAVLDEIEAAYQGEVYGEALYEGIAAAQADPERAWKWRVLAQMERETAALLAACLDRHGRTARPDPVALDRGCGEVADYGALGWEALMRRFAEELPADIAEYEALARRGGSGETAVLARLVEHEEVTLAFCLAEVAGDWAASLTPVLAMVNAPPPRP